MEHIIVEYSVVPITVKVTWSIAQEIVNDINSGIINPNNDPQEILGNHETMQIYAHRAMSKVFQSINTNIQAEIEWILHTVDAQWVREFIIAQSHNESFKEILINVYEHQFQIIPLSQLIISTVGSIMNGDTMEHQLEELSNMFN